MRNKLQVDGEAIGLLQDQFPYMFARLDRTLQNMAVAFEEKGGHNGSYDTQEFLVYLD